MSGTTKMENKDDAPQEGLVQRADSEGIDARRWTGEEDELLQRMWNDGHSAAEICVVLGRTRNAVVGRRWRLGQIVPDNWLGGRAVRGGGDNRRKQNTKSKRLVKPKGESIRKPPWSPTIVSARTRSRMAVLEFKRSKAEPKPECGIYELTDGVCRYIVGGERAVGDDPYRFCGQTTDYKSYCKEHAKIIYSNRFKESTDDISS